MENPEAIELPKEPRARRRRRTREDVTERIQGAARQLFAERGYASATTKEIARMADVSETLLFRYYGDKRSLFNEVVTAPFNRLMESFVERHPDRSDGSRDQDALKFVREVFTLFEDNQEMFRAILFRVSGEGREQFGRPPGGMDNFFAKAADYAPDVIEAGFSYDVAMRLGFGMIASAALFQEAFFPHGADRDELLGTLEQMVARAVWRAPAR